MPLGAPVGVLLSFEHHGTTLVDHDHAIGRDGFEHHLGEGCKTARHRGTRSETEPLALMRLVAAVAITAVGREDVVRTIGRQDHSYSMVDRAGGHVVLCDGGGHVADTGGR